MVEFFGGGYYLDFLALHLTLAYIAVAILTGFVFASKGTTLQKLVILYFSLTLFNNPAFQIAGASLGDIFGILAVLVFALRVTILGEYRRVFNTHHLTFGLIAGTSLIVVHQLVVGGIYSGLNEDGAWIVRAAVTVKIIVLAFVIWIFSQEFRDTESVHRLMDWIVSFALIGIGAYFIQCAILVTGKLPYGTFFDAGSVGIPTFGGVSVERGHFGKFLTPLYPFFLLMYLKHKRSIAWVGFLIVTTINISASSLAYFTAYLILTAVAFRSQLKRPKIFAGVIAGFACSIVLFVAMSNVIMGVVDKIVYLAFKGDPEGGRGMANLFLYLHRYPLGMSYGGSTLRNIPDLNEMNSGIMVWVTQFGVIAPIILGGYLMVLVSAYRNSKFIEDPATRKLLVIGFLMTLFIFSADVLWFVPTIWLPIILCLTNCIQGNECLACEKATLPKRSNYFKHCLSLAAASVKRDQQN